MITIDALTAKVKFGDSGNKAKIAVLANKGTLTLQELAKEKQIGEKLEEGDAKELPKIELEFTRLESIDVLIDALKVIKSNWMDANSYTLAC
jgi:hypothetical protein